MNYFFNQYHVAIKRICASCEFRLVDKSGRRTCIKREGNVEPANTCGEWMIHPKLENAGKGDGKIKNIEYLRAVINTRRVNGTGMAEVRKRWDEQNGSIYEVE